MSANDQLWIVKDKDGLYSIYVDGCVDNPFAMKDSTSHTIAMKYRDENICEICEVLIADADRDLQELVGRKVCTECQARKENEELKLPEKVCSECNKLIRCIDGFGAVLCQQPKMSSDRVLSFPKRWICLDCWDKESRRAGFLEAVDTLEKWQGTVEFPIRNLRDKLKQMKEGWI